MRPPPGAPLASATGSVSYFATAVDAYGNTGDSDHAVVTITN